MNNNQKVINTFRHRLIETAILNTHNLFSEAKARILGPGDLHVKAGSSVTLICVINQGPHDLGTVFWYLGANILQATPPHPNDAETSARISIQVITYSFRFEKLTFPFCRTTGPMD